MHHQEPILTVSLYRRVREKRAAHNMVLVRLQIVRYYQCNHAHQLQTAIW